MITNCDSDEPLGVKAAKAYLTRTGAPNTAQPKLPSFETVSNVRTPWQRGRKVTPKPATPSTGDSSLKPTMSRG